MPPMRPGRKKQTRRKKGKQFKNEVYKSVPPPPASMTGRQERALFSRVARILVNRGTLGKGDRDMLVRYVYTTVAMQRAFEDMVGDGRQKEGKWDNSDRQKIYAILSKDFQAFSAALGLGTLQRGHDKIQPLKDPETKDKDNAASGIPPSAASQEYYGDKDRQGKGT